ncbi:MAG: STAS domain-containing protein [Ignavibacteriaceae bacterium]
MSKFQYDEMNHILTLILDGELTIENLKDVKSLFLEAFEKSDSISLDHTNAKEYDFSYLQLLCSAVKTAEASGKKLFLRGNDSEAFKDLVKESGFSNTKFF